MSGDFNITLPLDDYLEGIRLLQRRTPARKWSMAAMFAAPVIILGFDIVGDMLSGTVSLERFLVDAIPFIIILAVALVALKFVVPLVVKLTSRSSYKQLALAGDRFSFTYDDAGIQIVTLHTTTNLEWHGWHGWTEDANSLLLLRTSNSAFIVPKHQVDVAQLDDLRATLVAANLPKR